MKIYLHKDDSRHGPFTIGELNERVGTGEFSPGDFACHDGKNWVRVDEVPGYSPVAGTKGRPGEELSAPSSLSHPGRKEPKAHQLVFHGTGSEFFGIWITNTFLTLCTLGIYSAWAKVRQINYFYGNTLLNGSSFSFVANPISILKGRLIALVFFGFYLYFQTVDPLISIWIMLAVLPFVPLLVVRSMRFRMQNTEFRGLRFNFSGSVGKSYGVYLGGLILSYITAGILFPWWECQKKQFLLGNLKYGSANFRSFPQVGAFYKCAGICLLASIGGFVLLMVVVMGVGAIFSMGSGAGSDIIPLVLGLLFYLFIGVMAAYWYTFTTNHVVEATSLPSVAFQSRMRTGEVLGLWVTNILLLVITIGLATPWVMVRNARYRISRTTVLADDLDSFVAGQVESTSALGEELGETIDLDIGI
ncbi:MAG: hypothetical protein CMI21_05965 [Opitutae bacterium]|nr:hypothetical protein [Opitutae bacterium]